MNSSSFFVNKWGENNEYNYCMDVDFKDSDNHTVFKKNDQVSITLKGTPNITATVPIDCVIATQAPDYTNWVQIGTTTELIKLEKGVPFEQKFNIIMDASTQEPDYIENIYFVYYPENFYRFM